MSPEEQFLEKGLLGAIIVVLFGVAGFFYNEVRVRDKVIAELQEKLLLMALEHAKTDADLANKVIETVRTLNDLFSSKNRGK